MSQTVAQRLLLTAKTYMFALCNIIICVAGMHKKSIEAAQKLKEEEDKSGDEGDDVISCKDRPASQSCMTSPSAKVNKDDLRFESIAQLRAKAQSYTAKIREGISNDVINVTDVTSTKHDVPTFSSFETPSKNSDSCDSEVLDPTN